MAPCFNDVVKEDDDLKIIEEVTTLSVRYSMLILLLHAKTYLVLVSYIERTSKNLSEWIQSHNSPF
jgi:hypothetical protein